MTVITELILTIKSLGKLAELFQSLISEVKDLRLAIEQKNLDQLKAETNEKIEQLKTAKSDADRMRIIVELSKLQK
jgi:hypothetical protein